MEGDVDTATDARRSPGGPELERPTVLVLVNPTARLAGAAAETEIGARLSAMGLRARIVLTRAEDEARAHARAAATEGVYDVVVAAGGDGTVHAVAEGLLEARNERTREDGSAREVALGILPLGTMNNLAHCLGIPEDLTAAAELLASAPSHLVDVGMVAGHLFLEVAGAGLEAALAPTFENLKGRPWAHPGTVLTVARTLWRVRPRRVDVTVDGRTVRTRALQVSVCNAERYGLDFAAAPGARMDDGWLDVVIYERIKVLELVRHYVSILGGRQGLHARERRLRAREVRIAPTRAVWHVHADAQTVGVTPMTAVVKHNALRVVAPPRAETKAEAVAHLGLGEVVLRAMVPPAAGVAARVVGQAAGSAQRTAAVSTARVRLAATVATDEARRVVGVEAPRRSARRAAAVRWLYLAAFGWALATGLAARWMDILPGDVRLTRVIQGRRTRRKDAFWRAVAEPGFPRYSTPLVVVCAAMFWALRLRVEAVIIILSNGTDAINWAIKRVVGRQRPTERLVRVTRVINEPGFPSGHVMHYMSFFGFLATAALSNLRPSRARRAFVGACAAMVGLVGPSRVYLGAHWPSDVLAGYLLGGIYLGGLLELYARAKAWAAGRRRSSTPPPQELSPLD
ncbi:MAG TPA: diacylglycerol kinase family protein [Ktedonobacterales bacterium]